VTDATIAASGSAPAASRRWAPPQRTNPPPHLPCNQRAPPPRPRNLSLAPTTRSPCPQRPPPRRRTPQVPHAVRHARIPGDHVPRAHGPRDDDAEPRVPPAPRLGRRPPRRRRRRHGAWPFGQGPPEDGPHAGGRFRFVPILGRRRRVRLVHGAGGGGRGGSGNSCAVGCASDGADAASTAASRWVACASRCARTAAACAGGRKDTDRGDTHVTGGEAGTAARPAVGQRPRERVKRAPPRAC